MTMLNDFLSIMSVMRETVRYEIAKARSKLLASERVSKKTSKENTKI